MHPHKYINAVIYHTDEVFSIWDSIFCQPLVDIEGRWDKPVNRNSQILPDTCYFVSPRRQIICYKRVADIFIVFQTYPVRQQPICRFCRNLYGRSTWIPHVITSNIHARFLWFFLFDQRFVDRIYGDSLLSDSQFCRQIYRQVYRQVFCIDCTAPLAWFHRLNLFWK